MYRLILNYMVIALTIGRKELTELVDRTKMKTKWQRFNLKVFLRAEWNLFNVFSIFLKEYSTKFTTIQFILSAMFFSYFRFLIFFSISNNSTCIHYEHSMSFELIKGKHANLPIREILISREAADIWIFGQFHSFYE